MIGDVNPFRICNVGNTLGEGVLWDHRTAMLQWTDIESACLWQWDMSDADPVRFNLPERLGSLALTGNPSIFLGAFESGFARFTLAPQTFELLAPVTQSTEHLRMNDGRVDRGGHFWAGSMAEKNLNPLGSLWRYDGQHKATAHVSDLRIPNSLCWSGDGRTMYLADSPRCTIWAFDFDPQDGPIGEPRIFAETLAGVHPDGSCIDAEDHLWNAQWGGGEVVRYRPDGSVERRVKLPVSQPSCVTFAGNDLNLLCITSARVDLSDDDLAKEPLAGALLLYQMDVIGRKEEVCSDQHCY